MSVELSSRIASYVRALVTESAAQQLLAQQAFTPPPTTLASLAQTAQAAQLQAGILERLALLQRLAGPRIGAGAIPPPATPALSGALPGMGLNLGPAGWPATSIGTAGGFNILPGLGGAGNFGVFGPGQMFGDTPWMIGGAGPSILGDGTRILLDTLAGIMNVINGADRIPITNFGTQAPLVGPVFNDGQQWLAQNWPQTAPAAPLPLGTPDWANALTNAGALPCQLDPLAALRDQLMSGWACRQQFQNACLTPTFNFPQQPAPSGKVYVFGNRDYPISTTKSSKKEVDLSKSLAQEFGVNKFDGLFNRLAPDAAAVSQNYGSMFGKSVVYGEDGRLIGIYDTKELEKLNGDYALYGNSTAKGKTLKTPDGRSFEIADNAFASPLAFDLDGNGIKTSTRTTQFDIDGDGKTDTINDVNEGILGIRGGKTGKDLFGNNTDLDGDGKADGYANGFEALRGLGEKAGVINAAKGDLKLDTKDLELLEKQYGLAMKQGYQGEMKSLRTFGVQEIDLSTAATATKDNFDGQGNRLQTQQGATFTAGGRKREYADVWHKLG